MYIKTKKGYAEIEGLSNVLYEKIDGKYVPTSEYINYTDYYRNGHYYLKVDTNGRTMTTQVYPNKQELHSAVMDKRDEIVSAIRNAMEMQPARKVTRKQRKAYDDFIATMGNTRYALEYKSLNEVVESIIECLMK